MEIIFNKIEQGQPLGDREREKLDAYLERLRRSEPDSFQDIYNRYANTLFSSYNIYVPRFTNEPDEFFHFLINNPFFLTSENEYVIRDVIPQHLLRYFDHTFFDGIKLNPLSSLGQAPGRETTHDLPQPREKDAVIKYESANPFKEAGLKSHFERLARYPFISRLQSYRYLNNNKASQDRIYVISGDTLGGIFTNKDRSIGYYIYLTENDCSKAVNACRLLNRELYDVLSGD